MCINKISEVLEEKGIGNIRPTDAQLEAMGITIHIWNKWYRKTADPEIQHLPAIADFLNCTIDELVRKSVAA